MLKKALLLIIFVLLAMLPTPFVTVKASPGIIYVPDHFGTIQEAVYNASLEDTIIVRAGIYEENVIVNQTVTLIGEDPATTIIDGSGTDNVVTLNNTSISISGFTIRNGKSFSGIEAPKFGNHQIFDNLLINNAFGINLLLTSGVTVVDNTLIDNSMVGIKVASSSNNNVSSNYVSQSAFGIKLVGSDNNFIVSNTVSDTSYGIYLYSSNWIDVDRNNVSGKTAGIYSVYSSDNNIRENIVSECAHGIELYGATRHNVLNNTASQNSDGIYLVSSSSSVVDSNLVSNNDWGIQFYGSDSNTVTYNTASYNAHGIWLAASSTGSSIYKNNFLGNTMQAFEHGDSPNTWYTTIKGKEYGNYWSDYLGEDTDGDGVGDYPPESLPHWEDEYPLMNPTVAMHDVAIINVETSSDTVWAGEVVEITVTARNEGTVNETFIVTARYYSRTIDMTTIINLGSCDSTTVVFSWNTTGVPIGFGYEISAEASPVEGETDKADNTLDDGTVFVTIRGDMGGDTPGSPPDGDVDRYDFGYFSDAYGSHEGDPNWNSLADLQGDTPGSPPDGDVDRYDFGVFSDNYGRTT